MSNGYSRTNGCSLERTRQNFNAGELTGRRAPPHCTEERKVSMQRAIEQAVEYAMKRMKVWQKLGFLGVVFLIPLTIFLFKTVASMRTMGVDLARQETAGVEYLNSLQTLLADFQQHRELAAALLNGDTGLSEKLTVEQRTLQN